MHCEHFKITQVDGIIRHDERTEKDNVKNRSNESIDKKRTKTNIHLTDYFKNETPTDFLKNFMKLPELVANKRKDLNVMTSWVLTVPKELPKEKSNEFLTDCYKFLKNRYEVKVNGMSNILTATIHNDETTPHLHFGFVPIVRHREDAKLHIDAKHLITRTELFRCHKDLEKMVKRDYHCSILTGETEVVGNRSIKELKEATEKSDLIHHDIKFKAFSVVVPKRVYEQLLDAYLTQKSVLGQNKALKKVKETSLDTLSRLEEEERDNRRFRYAITRLSPEAKKEFNYLLWNPYCYDYAKAVKTKNQPQKSKEPQIKSHDYENDR